MMDRAFTEMIAFNVGDCFVTVNDGFEFTFDFMDVVSQKTVSKKKKKH